LKATGFIEPAAPRGPEPAVETPPDGEVEALTDPEVAFVDFSCSFIFVQISVV
jgi:hypothetical protein